MTSGARMVQISVVPGGVPIPGSIGENLTIEGIDWDAVTPGAYPRLGEGCSTR